ncbi:BON domain-containing protein, partial [Dolichospermum sp. UHCC 0684]|uniref:BON domain-containing protein n=1 Tax=Dolichospermum sp. UHCC 0684 TaxID=3110242 RepID=UPI002B201D89
TFSQFLTPFFLFFVRNPGEVRSKLEANIPSSQLTVAAKDGAIVVVGNVQNQEQLNKINSLAKEIKGVRSVKVVVKIVPAVPSPKL